MKKDTHDCSRTDWNRWIRHNDALYTINTLSHSQLCNRRNITDIFWFYIELIDRQIWRTWRAESVCGSSASISGCFSRFASSYKPFTPPTLSVCCFHRLNRTMITQTDDITGVWACFCHIWSQTESKQTRITPERERQQWAEKQVLLWSCSDELEMVKQFIYLWLNWDKLLLTTQSPRQGASRGWKWTTEATRDGQTLRNRNQRHWKYWAFSPPSLDHVYLTVCLSQYKSLLL